MQSAADGGGEEACFSLSIGELGRGSLQELVGRLRSPPVVRAAVWRSERAGSRTPSCGWLLRGAGHFCGTVSGFRGCGAASSLQTARLDADAQKGGTSSVGLVPSRSATEHPLCARLHATPRD